MFRLEKEQGQSVMIRVLHKAAMCMFMCLLCFLLSACTLSQSQFPEEAEVSANGEEEWTETKILEEYDLLRRMSEEDE